jgi:IS1 family transposase
MPVLTIERSSSILVHMKVLDAKTKAQVLTALCEGSSIRSITRMFGVGKNTVASLLIDAGFACARFQDQALRNLSCKNVQCDEIWAFVGAKDKNVPADRKNEFGVGSVWTWTALDADTKLMCSWMVGNRGADAAHEFMQDLAGRLANRIQLTTDGHHVYANAVEAAFGANIDYAMLVKIYGESAEAEKRYSPAECIGARKERVIGNPDKKHISTSHVERQNLNMRMGMRRFTRLTNAFSKKLENHTAAVSLYFMYYNFVRIHQTLRVTPAMAAGVTERLWDIDDMIKLLEEYRAELAEEKKVENRRRIERSYSEYGDALGGRGVKF